MKEYKGIYFEHIGDKITGDILESVSVLFSSNLPSDYRKFLIEVNGGIPDKAFISFTMKDGFKNIAIIDGIFGIKSQDLNLLGCHRFYITRIPSNTICVAGCSGDLILLSIKGKDRGKIYFWDHNWEADIDNGEIAGYDNLTLIANSFDEFLGMLKDSENISS